MRRRAAAEAVRIYWITDSHYYEPVEDNPSHPDAAEGTRLFYTAGAKLRRYVDAVNADQPELALHTGDFIERQLPSVAPALALWDMIDATIPRVAVIGNHDLAGVTFETWRDALGLGPSEPGGSALNTSRAVTRIDVGLTIRVITVDTTLNDIGGHGPDVMGYFQPQTAAWLEAELQACPEEIVVIAMHHGPHDYASTVYFREADALLFSSIVGTVAQMRGLAVHTLFGHNHGAGNRVRDYENLTPQVPGYLSPVCVDHNPGWYTVANVFPDGSIWFDPHALAWPYP